MKSGVSSGALHVAMVVLGIGFVIASAWPGLLPGPVQVIVAGLAGALLGVPVPRPGDVSQGTLNDVVSETVKNLVEPPQGG